MASLQCIDKLVDEFSTEYPKADLPPIKRSGIYCLNPSQNKSINAVMCWPEAWPNNNERGLYAIFSDDELLYIGKASLQRLGSRLNNYFSSSPDKSKAATKNNHSWSKPPISLVTWAVPEKYFFEATALE